MFIGHVKGAPDTPFEGGKFNTKVEVPLNYPKEPPKVWFTTKIIHPNIFDDGLMCISSPKDDDWSEALSLHPFMIRVVTLLNGKYHVQVFKIDVDFEFFFI